MTTRNARHDVKVTTPRPRAVALTAALSLLALAGCAAEPAPASTADTAVVEMETAAPVAVGDTLTAEQANELNAGTDLMKAYPVGDQFIAVQWGQPLPEVVTAEVNAQIVAATGPGYGTNSDLVSEDVTRLLEAQKAETEKLGGITVASVQCALSFSTVTNAFEPAWVISEPGPVGQYGSREEAIERADAWAKPGKTMYVVINNLGC